MSNQNTLCVTEQLQRLSLVEGGLQQVSSCSSYIGGSGIVNANLPYVLDISHELSRGAFQIWDTSSCDFIRGHANEYPCISPISEMQRYTLERVFNNNPQPDISLTKHLSEITGLSQEFVYSWFRVKRCIGSMKMVVM
ncbi:hypothetical protein NADFUDRAFT_82726 [Nadsonia fulvescens var. elongata DSM 6958]|uniref:Homeobox domain-containing protein n=1 Tax=Nadsonia fulvescens var. elongata DSM 6958 TaxID=857566 RepID=A0A1E3PJZ6_9ASCO|nr:hypothetical protein NADFUDRAFT_82726 [Nadsonia fulvescens var. elongata DSM 6958]